MNYGYIHRYTPAPVVTGIRRTYEAIRTGIKGRGDIHFVGENVENVRGFERNFLEDGYLAKRGYPDCMVLIFDMIPFYDSDFQNSRTYWQPSFDALRHYSRVLVPTEWVKKNLVQDFGCDPEKVEVQLLGVDREIFKPLDLDVDAWKRVHWIPVDRLTIGHCSYGYTRKNVERILKAMSHIPDAIFVKVGKDNLTDSLVRAASLEDRVFYLENLGDAELAEFYNAVDVFAFPSTSEGFGLPALEAQACGTPTITSRGTALEELTGPGAVAVDPFSLIEIRAALRKLPARIPVSEDWLSKFDWKNIGSAVNLWLS